MGLEDVDSCLQHISNETLLLACEGKGRGIFCDFKRQLKFYVYLSGAVCIIASSLKVPWQHYNALWGSLVWCYTGSYSVTNISSWKCIMSCKKEILT